ncbi:MAG: DUF2079 domain-containing protein, partial [Candidatus Eisenbacteria bacterium]|nr:DUF2079 domain-containing protein [Candidatus Eisenbacteria bacterium]
NLIYWFLVIPYRAWTDPILLLILNSLACAAAGLGLFYLARAFLDDSPWSLAAPLVFFISPLVQDANLYDYHSITLATAFLVWGIWAFETGRPRAAWTLIVLALLCKEDVPLVVMMLGLVYLPARATRRRGVLLLAAGAVYLTVVMGVVVPAFNEGQLTTKIEGRQNRYAWLWQRPELILQTLTRPDRLRLPLYFLLSGVLVAWRGRRWLWMMLPALAMGFFSWTTWMTRLTGAYYWITAEAVIIIACLAAARPRERTGRIRRSPLVYLMAATVAFSLLFSPLPYSIWVHPSNFAAGVAREELQELRAAIPRDASLSVQNNLGPHLAHRWNVAAFPRGWNTARFILLHMRYPGGPANGLFVRTQPQFLYQLPLRALASGVADLAHSPEWGLVVQKNGFYLLERDRPDILRATEVRVILEEDTRRLMESFARAEEHRSPLADYVVDGISWAELLGRR